MTATRLRWVLLAVAAAAGVFVFAIVLDPGVRAVCSYLGGLLMVIGAFEFGAFNIRFTGRYLPRLTLVVAMASYLTTAIAFGLVLAASTPRVVDATAVASGLLVGLPIWIWTEIARVRVRSEVL